MGKFGTFEVGLDLPGEFWSREFSDRGLASDLFTLLGGGLSTVSDANRKEKARKEELGLKKSQFDAEMALDYAKMDQDEDQFGRKLASDEWQAGLGLEKSGKRFGMFDTETGAFVVDETATSAPVGPNSGGVRGFPAAGGCANGQCGTKRPAPAPAPMRSMPAAGGWQAPGYEQSPVKPQGVKSMPAAGGAQPSKPGRYVRVQENQVPQMRAQWEKNQDDVVKAKDTERKEKAAKEEADARDRRFYDRMSHSEQMTAMRLEHSEAMAVRREEAAAVRQEAQFAFSEGQAAKGAILRRISEQQDRLFQLEDQAGKLRLQAGVGDADSGLMPFDPKNPPIATWDQETTARHEPIFRQYTTIQQQIFDAQKAIKDSQAAYEQTFGKGPWAVAEVEAQTPPTHVGSAAGARTFGGPAPAATPAPAPAAAPQQAQPGVNMKAQVDAIMNDKTKTAAQKRAALEALRAPGK